MKLILLLLVAIVCSALSNSPPTSLPRHGHPKVGRYDLGVLLKGHLSMQLTKTISIDITSKNTQK